MEDEEDVVVDNLPTRYLQLMATLLSPLARAKIYSRGLQSTSPYLLKFVDDKMPQKKVDLEVVKDDHSFQKLVVEVNALNAKLKEIIHKRISRASNFAGPSTYLEPFKPSSVTYSLHRWSTLKWFRDEQSHELEMAIPSKYSLREEILATLNKQMEDSARHARSSVQMVLG